ncbi:MAG TPA: class F sortase [Luteimicrobium sp.]|nr:class F sortase [Luteimicrobium sp.]
MADREDAARRRTPSGETRRRSLATAAGVVVLAAGALAGSVSVPPRTGVEAAAAVTAPSLIPEESPESTAAPSASASAEATGARGAPGGTPPATTRGAETAGTAGSTAERHVPTRISVPSVGIDAGVTVYTDAMVRANDGWVDPPDRFSAAWWSGGGAPQSRPTNTVYVYGHVSRITAVFNALHEVREGDLVRLTTAAGTLTYRVAEVPSPILKTALSSDPRITAAVPGRLVLVGCYRAPDQGTRPTTKNFVVIAQQVR